MLPASQSREQGGTMSVELKVHDLQEDMEGTQSFESVQAAKAWLVDRPKFVQVFGIASADISKEVNNELRACMRALDDDERKLKEEIAAKVDEAARQRAKANREEEHEHHRAEMAAADPNRLMNVSYRHKTALVATDVADLREITPEMTEAVMAWINERNTWVERRGQVVGVANIKVWPGPLPEGHSERVVEGDFVPFSKDDDD